MKKKSLTGWIWKDDIKFFNFNGDYVRLPSTVWKSKPKIPNPIKIKITIEETK